ncbi:hypothetical protein [Streptomyces mirabilis]
MKPRKGRTASLFVRSEAEWVAIKGDDRGAAFLASAPAIGIPCLIRNGALTTAEADMIRAVAEGRAQHEFLTPDRAKKILLKNSDI